MLAQPDSRVKSFGHNIGQAVVDRHLDRDIGIIRHQPHQRRFKDSQSGMFGCGDADGARGFVAQRFQLGKFRLNLAHTRLNHVEQPLACLGQGHRPRGPRQKAHAEALFQLADGLA